MAKKTNREDRKVIIESDEGMAIADKLIHYYQNKDAKSDKQMEAVDADTNDDDDKDKDAMKEGHNPGALRYGRRKVREEDDKDSDKDADKDKDEKDEVKEDLDDATKNAAFSDATKGLKAGTKEMDKGKTDDPEGYNKKEVKKDAPSGVNGGAQVRYEEKDSDKDGDKDDDKGTVDFDDKDKKELKEKKKKLMQSYRPEDQPPIETRMSVDDINAVKQWAKEDVSSMFNGQTLTEEFKSKAAVVLEARMISVAKKINGRLTENANKVLKQRLKESANLINETMDTYCEYISRQWLSENKLAIEQGARNEIAESFMEGLRDLLERHYINVPAKKLNILEQVKKNYAELTEKYDVLIDKNMRLVRILEGKAKSEIFEEVTKDLAESDKEKLRKLTEDVTFKSGDDFKKRLSVIKEDFLPKNKTANGLAAKITDKTVINEDVVHTKEDGKTGDKQIDAVKEALKRLKQSD